jgi:hypothetical protein
VNIVLGVSDQGHPNSSLSIRPCRTSTHVTLHSNKTCWLKTSMILHLRAPNNPRMFFHLPVRQSVSLPSPASQERMGVQTFLDKQWSRAKASLLFLTIFLVIFIIFNSVANDIAFVAKGTASSGHWKKCSSSLCGRLYVHHSFL